MKSGIKKSGGPLAIMATILGAVLLGLTLDLNAISLSDALYGAALALAFGVFMGAGGALFNWRGLASWVNSQAMCTSFKTELMMGIHALGTSVIRAATTADTIKAALFLATASLGAATTTYSTTGEATGTGYNAGGIVVTNGTAPSSSGTTAIWTPSGNLVYPTVTISNVDTVLLYNSSQGNRAISVHTFGAQTITAGTLTLGMPTNDASNALLRLA